MSGFYIGNNFHVKIKIEELYKDFISLPVEILLIQNAVHVTKERFIQISWFYGFVMAI